MITKRALLVCNPGEDSADNYCKGVFADMANYRAWLLSSNGGLWLETEIETQNRPTKTELNDAIDKLKYRDYSFVVFAGHGWYSSVEKCSVLTLRKGQEVPSHVLLQGAPKHTAIFDACSEVYHESITESERKAVFMSKAAAAMRRNADPKRCREHFSRQVTAASNGLVEINSCNIDETAGDDPLLGGRYSSSLVASGRAWSEDESKKPAFSAASALSIVEAHFPAAEHTQRQSGNRQNPQIAYPRTTRNYFPFAVFA